MVAGVEVELVAVLCDKGVYGADCERHAGWGGGGVKEGGGVEEARNVYGLGKGIRKCS